MAPSSRPHPSDARACCRCHPNRRAIRRARLAGRHTLAIMPRRRLRSGCPGRNAGTRPKGSRGRRCRRRCPHGCVAPAAAVDKCHHATADGMPKPSTDAPVVLDRHIDRLHQLARCRVGSDWLAPCPHRLSCACSARCGLRGTGARCRGPRPARPAPSWCAGADTPAGGQRTGRGRHGVNRRPTLVLIQFR
jgi:hypothetical protein